MTSMIKITRQRVPLFADILAALLTLSIVLALGQSPPQASSFKFSSPAFVDKGSYPVEYTCDGASASPPLAWSNPPAGTKAFAITMLHIPRDGGKHVYWVIANIPASTRSIPKNYAKAGVMGLNTINDQAEYAPPCSKGPGPKWYTLTLYALSEKASLPTAWPTMDELVRAIKDKTLAMRTLRVVYDREPRGN